jgi:hypothetical protein
MGVLRWQTQANGHAVVSATRWLAYSVVKDANRTNSVRVGEQLTPPNRFNTRVARTEGYTYAAKVWALSFVQELFSVAPVLGD